MKLTSFIQETFMDAIKTLTSKEGIKNLYRTSLYRNAVYLMFNSVVLAATGFFFWMVAARFYSTEGVGLSSAAISAMRLLAMLSTLGLDYGLIRFLPAAKDKSRDMINSCFTIGVTVSVGLSLVFLAGVGFWSPRLLLIRAHPIFFTAFIIFTVGITLQTFTQQIFIAKRKAEFTLAQGLSFGLLRFIPLIILVNFFQTFGIFISWGSTVLVVVAVAIIFLFPKVQTGYFPFPRIRKEVINDILHFSAANYTASIFWAIPGFVLPLMVVNLLGAEQNAYFYIGWSIGNILSVVPAAASLSLFAEGSYNEERLVQEVKRSFKLILVILIPAIIIILPMANKILLLFGQAYSKNATKLVWILAISALPLSINYLYFSIRRVKKKMRNVIGLSGFIAVFTLGLTYVLLPQVGIIGAGIAWLFSQGVAAIFIMRNLFRNRSEVKPE